MAALIVLVITAGVVLAPLLTLAALRHLFPKRAPPPPAFKVAHVPAGLQPKKRKFVVTGGAGFLGSHLVDMLLSAKGRDYDVVSFDQKMPPKAFLSPGATYCLGNLLDAEDCLKAVEGADCVFHVAGVTPSLTVPAELMWSVNLRGTENIIAACKKQKVAKLVYTSSATCIFSPHNDNLVKVDETYPLPATHIDTYTATKAAAEQLVLQANSPSTGFLTCAVRPGGIFGPGDRQLLDRLIAGEDRIYLGEGTCIIDVTDVANVAFGHVCAERALGVNPAVAGNAFNVSSGVGIEYRRLIGWSDQRGAPSHWGWPQPDKVPIGVAYALGFVNEWAFRLFGVVLLSDILAVVTVKFTQRTYIFSCSKAERELGFKPLRSIDDAIAAYVKAWKAGEAKRRAGERWWPSLSV